VARGQNKVNLQTGHRLPFTYLFDLDYFNSTLASSCPQITLLPSHDDLHLKSTPLDPKTLAVSLIHDTWPEMIEVEGWSAAFASYLHRHHPSISAENPALITLATPLFQFPLSYDKPEFVSSFGRILRFRPDVRRVAATVLYALANSSSGSMEDVEFYGAHLRTAEDAKAASWTNYSVQSHNLLSSATKHGLRSIYLATGLPSDRTTFIADAAALTHPIAVTTKSLLLSSPAYTREREEMQSWTWDQQALVDYEVLLRSAAFGGTWESSFAWNIAVRRIWAEGGKVVKGEGVSYGDEMESNTIFGPEGVGWYFEEGMWP